MPLNWQTSTAKICCQTFFLIARAGDLSTETHISFSHCSDWSKPEIKWNSMGNNKVKRA